MKNILIYSTLLILFISCGKSNLDKAREIYRASSSQISRRQNTANLNDAVTILKSYLQEHPENIHAHILLWKCYLKQENPLADSLENKLLKNNDNLLNPLLDHLNDNDEIIRQKVVTLIGKLNNPDATSNLIKILKNDKYQNVQQAAAEALVKLKSEEAVPVFLEKLNSSYPSVRYFAVKALGHYDQDKIPNKLVEILSNPNERTDVRHQAALAIGKIGNKSVKDGLLKLYKNPANSAETKLLSIIALSHLGHPVGFDFAMEKVSSTDNYITCLSIQALGYIQNPKALPVLIDFLKYGNKANRQFAAEALGRIGNEKAIPALKDALSDPVAEVSSSAKSALKQISSS